MTTNLQQRSYAQFYREIQQPQDRLTAEIYRQLSDCGLQYAVYKGGMGDSSLELYCRIFAQECVTRELRSDFENEIVRGVHDAARSQGRTIAEFAQALSKAIVICGQQEEES